MITSFKVVAICNHLVRVVAFCDHLFSFVLFLFAFLCHSNIFLLFCKGTKKYLKKYTNGTFCVYVPITTRHSSTSSNVEVSMSVPSMTARPSVLLIPPSTISQTTVWQPSAEIPLISKTPPLPSALGKSGVFLDLFFCCYRYWNAFFLFWIKSPLTQCTIGSVPLCTHRSGGRAEQERRGSGAGLERGRRKTVEEQERNRRKNECTTEPTLLCTYIHSERIIWKNIELRFSKVKA